MHIHDGVIIAAENTVSSLALSIEPASTPFEYLIEHRERARLADIEAEREAYHGAFENNIGGGGDYSGELMREQGHRQSVGIVHNKEHRKRREPDNNERIAEQSHIF